MREVRRIDGNIQGIDMHDIPAAFAAVRAAFAVLLTLSPLAAGATDFPVSGTLSVNGNSGALPAGGVFGGSSYDPGSGAIAAGAFAFPQSTISFDSSFGTVVVTYQFSQTNTSTGQVAADGVAALTDAAMRLEVTHVTVSGFPISVGTCVFAPIDLVLAGTGSAAGLDLSDDGFTIPAVASSDCGGYGDQINDGVAGSNNSIQTHLDGNFTPPAASDDTIFANGFDLAMAAE